MHLTKEPFQQRRATNSDKYLRSNQHIRGDFFMINTWRQYALGLATAVAASATLLAGSAHASGEPHAPTVAKPSTSHVFSICYRAHVQNIGWQGWVCNGAIAGTTGQSLRLEALQVQEFGAGAFCAEAHVQNIGWQGARCGNDGDIITVGTTGQSLRMEALRLNMHNAAVCANAHVQNIGWQGWRCAAAGNLVTVGTTGQSLRMEAVAIDFLT